ncbi:MAG TPA: TonB-dependent receptor [Allosphingosinicella sp.]
MSKSFWLVSAGMFALAATPGYAQDQTTPTGESSPVEQAAEVDAENDVTATDAATGDEGDIVITAQGRTQILQDVPIAVSAVSAASLQNSGANDIRALNQLAPSLLVSSTGSEANGSARIRGIGTVGDNPGLESSVAVFVDGVYRSRSGVGLNELGEVERIEVLRGPQGTLFGRNASAGLIHVISKKPNMNQLEGFGSLTYGNHDYIRADAGITGPIGDTLGFRLDGVYSRRDGFYNDVNNNGDVNDRNRFFVRGQLLFEPNADLSVRLIGDYTTREEACCGAVYIGRDFNPRIGNLNEPATPLLVGGVPNPNGNNIINVLRDLGTPLVAFNDPFSRNIYVNAGRTYEGDTRDWGLSGEVNWDLGGAELTSITAYRQYRSGQPGDIDYSPVDILYRSPVNNGLERRFKTFSQELRLQGNAFNDKLDWLVGAYFADEDLQVTDNLRFGTQYGRFATCRLISGTALAGFYSPTTPGCISPTGRAVIGGALAPGIPSPFGPAGPSIIAAFDRLEAINDRGSTIDRYHQDSRNWAIFTHNIFHLSDSLTFTLGLRYTNEKKDFDATFGNDNTGCVAQQNALVPFLANPGLAALAGGLIGLSCQGNSTAELNGVSINDDRSESEFTGTGILAWKPTDDLLLYGSYSRGYKAGGFNLDRSAFSRFVALNSSGVPVAGAVCPTSGTVPAGCASGGLAGLNNLQFRPEINDALEAGLKYNGRGIDVNVAVFRQLFSDFQLNTFNGVNFFVENINSCKNDLNGADTDNSQITPTGACDKDDLRAGVQTRGIEVEVFTRPLANVTVNVGGTLADTRYRKDLVGAEGRALSPALFQLPGRRVSNSSRFVATSSVGWTPPIGNSGLRGLIYLDARHQSSFNTGSDLDIEKIDNGYTVFNGRVGLRGPNNSWALELWGQNLLNANYKQVAFDGPLQGSCTTLGAQAGFCSPVANRSTQLFGAFLAEPRTYGLTLRAKFAPPPAVAAEPFVAPPPPPPAPPATQTCPDGSVILATDSCPLPPPPPPPPAPEPERG